MAETLKKMYAHTLNKLQLLYNTAVGIDHKILSHYVLKISQLQDIDNTVYQTADCLQTMLGYRLFAFAMYDREYNGGLDIWMAPHTDNLAVLDFIKKDFSPADLNCNIRYFDDNEKRMAVLPDGDIRNITVWPVIDGQTKAVLYLLPRRTILHYHREILEIIVKAIRTSLLSFINIKKLESAALIDPLTHCYNRRALDNHLAQDVAGSERYGTDLALVMLDIDYFKSLNDNHGHQAGDTILRAMTTCFMAAIRKSDYLARYGGEEFVLVLPRTNFSKAIELAERLRHLLEKLQITFEDKTLQITASFGVAFFKKGMHKDALLQRADEMLYEAKRQGRNRIKPDLRVYLGQKALPEEEPILH